MNKITTLGEFILAEMKKRKISEREFGKNAGIAHNTLGGFINNTHKGYPSLGVLLKIANYTNVDICYLMMLVAPDAFRTPVSDLDALAIGQKVRKASRPIRQAIDRMLIEDTSDDEIEE